MAPRSAREVEQELAPLDEEIKRTGWFAVT